ncbi:hypothetical protein WR25_26258 [Diploscapter pachys]|uniref:PABS domain-containing protein n=1 Tax=Diploscapter pachys TaxID=2018661 RepID=A0A2A2JSY7_9BILA|nr:hypothetical protein WR25_26258 [Diploscapter pachys]
MFISGLTEQNRDSSNWEIDRTKVEISYVKLQLAVPFFMEAMNFDPKIQKKALMIGLGGGIASNFYTHFADEINLETTVVEIDGIYGEIAKKWFGYLDHPKLKLVIDDGVNFIKKERENGNKYDTIILDACNENKNLNIICPCKAFMVESAIEDLSHILTDNGILSVNVFTKHPDESNPKVLETYKKFFKSCFLLAYTYANPNHRLFEALICSNRPNWTWDSKKLQFVKHFKQVDEKFDFGLDKFIVY